MPHGLLLGVKPAPAHSLAAPQSGYTQPTRSRNPTRLPVDPAAEARAVPAHGLNRPPLSGRACASLTSRPAAAPRSPYSPCCMGHSSAGAGRRLAVLGCINKRTCSGYRTSSLRATPVARAAPARGRAGPSWAAAPRRPRRARAAGRRPGCPPHGRPPRARASPPPASPPGSAMPVRVGHWQRA